MGILVLIVAYCLMGAAVGYLAHYSNSFMLKYSLLKARTRDQVFMAYFGHWGGVFVTSLLWPVALLVELINFGK